MDGKSFIAKTREYYKGKCRRNVGLLFDWFGLVCFANKNKNFQLPYSWFQTSQTGGQQYIDTSPFSIPCKDYKQIIYKQVGCRWHNKNVLIFEML